LIFAKNYVLFSQRKTTICRFFSSPTNAKGAGQLGKIAKGTYTIVGGTGKSVGVQGEGEFTRFMLRPTAKGVGAGFCIVKGNWKTVEPKK
jgi:hypothetical protein